jgi:DNA invertase Pin-like site-specific DNA recombinase
MTLRAAIYARFSSEMQRSTSIDDQIAVARQHADRHGWRVLNGHIYTDEAMSGVSLDRPGLQALLATAATRPRPFDVLLVDDTSRIARDLSDALRLLQRLKFCGVRVVYISQNIDSSHEQAETLIAVHGVVDNLYVVEMAQKIKRGLKGQHARGFATGGRTFGYRTVPVPDPSGKRDPNGYPAVIGHRLEVVPEEAEIVRQVFTWYADGSGTSTIVERLNQTGSHPSPGKKWKAGAVARLLTNERYRGLQIWGQKKFERRPETRQKVARAVPRSEWQIAERPDLRIVSEALWASARARQQEVRQLFGITEGRTLARGKNGLAYSKHLFTGRLRCGTCGGGMTTVCSGHGSPRYGCVRSWKNGPSACSNRRTVRAKVADPALLAGLQAMLLNPATVRMVTAAVTAAVRQQLSKKPARRQELEEQRSEARRKLENLIAALEENGPSVALREAVRTREAAIARIEDQLATLERPAATTLAVMPGWIREQLKDLAGMLTANTERTRAELAKLGVSFTLTPVTPREGRPFLQAEGTTHMARLLAGPTHGSTGDRSLLRRGP